MKYEKSIQGEFTGFINKTSLLANEKAFVAVSADKSVKVFNSETLESIIKVEGVHASSIMDCWITEANAVLTASSDRTIKSHKFDAEAGSLTAAGEFTLNETDAASYKENFMKQQLAVAHTNGSIYAVSCNSDINVWDEGAPGASKAIVRGHTKTVTCMTAFQRDGKSHIITGDAEGRIITWDSELKTCHGERTHGIMKHPLSMSTICAGKDYVYSADNGNKMMQWKLVESTVDGSYHGLQSTLDDFVQADQKVLKMAYFNENLFTMNSDKTISKIDGNSISTTHVKSEPLEKLGPKGDGSMLDFTIVEQLSQIWVSDSNGFVSVLDLDLKPVAQSEEQAGALRSQNGHKADKICSFSSGEKVIIAVGDVKGYVTVFDCQTFANLGYFAAHKKSSKTLQITADGRYVISVGNDNVIVLNDLQDMKTMRKMACANGNASTEASLLLNIPTEEGTSRNIIATAGEDCAVRLWKY